MTNNALASLLAEMEQGGDFPALSHTITEINQAVGDENMRASRLTDIILRDVALTRKLLRLVNAAHYSAFGSQPISTISRAVVILGFNAVRDVAVSLLLFEHLRNHANVDVLRGEAVDSFYRGVLGRLLAVQAQIRDDEEAFIGALFRDLGRLMARFHFFPQTEQVQQLMDQDLLDEQTASKRILGVAYDDLGLAIARQWHFPPSLLHAMSPLDPGPIKRASESDRLRLVANLARELHRGIAGKSQREQESAIEALSQRFREAIPVSRESLMETARHAAETLRNETALLNFDIRQSALLRQLLQSPADAAELEAADLALPDEGTDATSALALGLQDMTAMMLSPYHLADIFKLVAELFYRTELFDRVLICVLDRPSQTLVGRVGLGRDAAALRERVRIPLAFTPDVFQAAVGKGQDILISDASADNIRARIPEWHARTFRAKAFLLLPIMVKGKPLGLIYADKIADSLRLPAHLLGLLKVLRNQAALALHHKQ